MSITTALEARRDALREREAGFTLIELLVVVIIIGILAAIAIPIYIGVQNNAKDKAAISDLTNARTAIVAYYSDKGTYPTTVNAATLGGYGFVGTGVTDNTSGTAAVTSFCLTAPSDSGAVFDLAQSGAPYKVGDTSATKPSNCK